MVSPEKIRPKKEEGSRTRRQKGSGDELEVPCEKKGCGLSQKRSLESTDSTRFDESRLSTKKKTPPAVSQSTTVSDDSCESRSTDGGWFRTMMRPNRPKEPAPKVQKQRPVKEPRNNGPCRSCGRKRSTMKVFKVYIPGAECSEAQGKCEYEIRQHLKNEKPQVPSSERGKRSYYEKA